MDVLGLWLLEEGKAEGKVPSMAIKAVSILLQRFGHASLFSPNVPRETFGFLYANRKSCPSTIAYDSCGQPAAIRSLAYPNEAQFCFR